MSFLVVCIYQAASIYLKALRSEDYISYPRGCPYCAGRSSCVDTSKPQDSEKLHEAGAGRLTVDIILE